MLTTHAKAFYSDIEYTGDAYLLFGRETAGLPDEIHSAYPDHRFRIPMRNHERARSLNLSNSVNIVLYEALRQLGFPELI